MANEDGSIDLDIIDSVEDEVILSAEQQAEKATKDAADKVIADKVIADKVIADAAAQTAKDAINDGKDTPPKTDEGTETKFVEINTVKYQIDADNNAIYIDGDNKGKVFKTEQEIADLYEDAKTDANSDANDDNAGETKTDVNATDKATIVNTAYSEYITASGAEVLDTNGKPIEYEASPKGLAQRERELLVQREGSAVQAAFDEFFNTNPDIYEAYSHKQVSGSLEGYDFDTDYTKIEIAKDNVAQHKEIIIKAELMLDGDRTRAEMMAEMYVDKNKSYNASTAALKKLTDARVTRIKDNQDVIDKANTTQAAKNTELWTKVEGILDSGKLLGITIPNEIKVKTDDGKIVTRKREDFLNFMKTPIVGGDNAGYTEAQVKAINRSVETSVYLSYLDFTRQEIGSLVDSKVNAKVVSGLRKLVPKRQDSNSGTLDSATNTNDDVDNIVDY